jgi:hypothetical protein
MSSASHNSTRRSSTGRRAACPENPSEPLSVGIVLLDLVPASRHQPDLFAADQPQAQKLSPLIDRINNRYGRCAIGFGLFPPNVRAFKAMPRFTGCRRGGSFKRTVMRRLAPSLQIFCSTRAVDGTGDCATKGKYLWRANLKAGLGRGRCVSPS